ncbi:diguanylate cyclase (GGDEF) domain-containing protein [Pseudobutyrivibrio sp. UC1225]|uniref:GGDEF domain-containing protein n=1 Tax=Pseudobutyrivibrio sp. UC1225 TaxID=1798185 RepID=UPI0008EE5A7C|nr:GGDEF domain-containing protein [Pseudobutyrivibrio sp. UC1225]SFN62059.1 diguanylate cyclase (GGDEF) domain-containing protein [Pseudobutyrivibrio sp. UC1225]
MIEVPGWVILNFFTSFLLILLLIFQNKTSRLQKGKSYSAILICTLVLLLSESIGRVGENNPDSLLILARVGYFIIFILDPVDILFAVNYIDCWMDKESNEARTSFKTAFQAFAFINIVLVTMSSVLQLGWFFYFKDGLYFRGQFFMIRAVLIMVFIILLLVYTVVFRSDFMSEYKNMILFLPIFSLIGALSQVFFSSIDTTYAGISLGCLILFFFFQSNDVNVDYLTGVLNRRGLDIRMEEKIKSSQQNKRNFAAIMMDIDNFKTINDTFGHDEGDRAIKYMADILLNLFGRESTIARFGGDEFCVITDNVSQAELEDLILQAREKLANIRDKRKWHPDVDISCGYEIYSYTSGLSREEFTDNIDNHMYEQKQLHHGM